jgi:hypothetical protein
VNVTTLGLAGTLTGGVINGTSGTIGGVGHAGNVATASGGFQVVANGGRLYGDANNAYVRVGGGGSYVAVTTGGISFNGGVTDFNNTARLLGNNVLQYYYNGNSQAANVAPSLYSGGDPGAGNFPDGTIWIN